MACPPGKPHRDISLARIRKLRQNFSALSAPGRIGRMKISRSPAALAILLAAPMLGASPDSLDVPEPPAPSVCPAIDVPAPVASRVRVFVDPATGQFREPTADELRQIAEKRRAERLAAPPRVFEVVTYPDGMVSVDLGDAFLFDVRMVKDPDGTSRMECLPHPATPSAPRAEER